ncbi:MAG: hypothetical protein [Wendovervirus sonii]|uniref:BspA family leucine-rich repeat surface protein n=1 Tax=phage Lak_Megaphage_Sonny TaxID=3109229 RepID=A0ABZ0Z4U1_9CAUD|nr:MAG: hypothetical protein [phage Lak_Megaphage_Sonny]
MKQIYKKIYEAINTGIQKALALDDEDDVSIIYQHKKIFNKNDYFNYLMYQEKYKELINKKDFQGCLNLYKSEYLEQQPKTIGYKPESKEELKELVKNFNNIEIWNNFDLNWIDVSEITDMSSLFTYLTNFNCNISEWDVSNVTDMSGMFNWCQQFNQDISHWNVSNVKDMSFMFNYCSNFNSDLSQWNVSEVKDMSYMFEACYYFNQNLRQWDVSNVKNVFRMFKKCPIKKEYKPKFKKMKMSYEIPI